MSFRHRQTSKLFDIYFILFFSLFMKFFFHEQLSLHENVKKKSLRQRKGRKSAVSSLQYTPFFVCVRPLCGGAHLRRLLQKLSGLLNAPRRTEEAENRRGTRRKREKELRLLLPSRAERSLYGRKGERIGGTLHLLKDDFCGLKGRSP